MTMLDSTAADIASTDTTGAMAGIKPSEKPVYEQVRDQWGRSYATGKRKNAIAKVWIKQGSGQWSINGKPMEKYFGRPVLRMVVEQPLDVVGKKGMMDVVAQVRGGGLSGQAGAIKHGIAKALTLFQPDVRPALKKEGFLTRDSRVVERKKYGHPKARRSFQFSKR